MAVRTSYTIALTSLLVPLFSFPVVANDQDTNLRIQQRDALSAQEKKSVSCKKKENSNYRGRSKLRNKARQIKATTT